MLIRPPNQGPLPSAEAECLTEVRERMLEMAELLTATRAQIAHLAPPRGSAAINEASDTLDLVVAETEHAAFEIMRQAERAQAAARRLMATGSPLHAADAAEVDEAATGIVLACVFQDLTGQRIRKVIGALHEVEARVAEVVEVLGVVPAEVAKPVGDAALLNGPSTPDQGGLGQGAVDDLFS